VTLLRLAIRNLRGAGIRTWLNAIALSFAFVAIIFGQGMLQGMNKQAESASIAFEFGGGQYWQENYDPFDPLTLENAHATMPASLESLAAAGKAAPVLVVAGSIYPQGRIKPVLIKGIDPNQRVLAIPTQTLSDTSEPLPLLIGSRMAQATGLSKGDYVTVQWRDADGTFDARDGRIVEVMNTTVLTVDQGQVWMPLDTLRSLVGLPGQATIITLAKGLGRAGHDRIVLNSDRVPNGAGWKFHSDDDLMADLRQVVASKTIGQSIMFTVLFLLAMLAIFDTQVLSIFRRRREIGMLIALGMTRGQVILLFTLEGALHSILAAILGLLYGGPFFYYLGRNGFAIPGGASWGIAIGDRLYPAFTAGLVLGTTVLVFVVTSFVAWLPTRRIAKLKPTDALAGRGT
jgi:putative ABC transport system permease protein